MLLTAAYLLVSVPLPATAVVAALAKRLSRPAEPVRLMRNAVPLELLICTKVLVASAEA